MPQFSPTGAPTGNVTQAPSSSTVAGADAIAAGNAAGAAWEAGLTHTLPGDVSSAQLYAAAWAAGYAGAGGSYEVGYQAAYTAWLTTAAQVQADFAAGQRGLLPSLPTVTAADPGGFLFWQNATGELDLGLFVNAPPASPPAPAAANFPAPPALDLPSFGTPGTTGSQQPDDAASAASQGPAVAPQNALTLADQLEAVPRARTTAAPGAGVVKPLRRQMRKFQKRGRR